MSKRTFYLALGRFPLISCYASGAGSREISPIGYRQLNKKMHNMGSKAGHILNSLAETGQILISLWPSLLQLLSGYNVSAVGFLPSTSFVWMEESVFFFFFFIQLWTSENADSGLLELDHLPPGLNRGSNVYSTSWLYAVIYLHSPSKIIKCDFDLGRKW